MKKLISCASYYGSGSSAITDLIGEYEGVKSLTEYEFRFIHDIDGIMDLEYHLVINPNRHNSGHALKRFWKFSEFNSGTWFDKRYERFFDGHYKRITKEYIESLTDLKYPGYWYVDLYEKGKCFYYRKSIEGKIAKILLLNRFYNKMPGEFTYCSLPSEEKFINLTQKYIEDLLRVANKENADYLMMDQLTPSSNINRCLRYFKNDICTFIVDRDPRDIFVANKMIWKENIVPSDVDKFCKWFLFTRGCANGQELDSQKVMKIQFENMFDEIKGVKTKMESFDTLFLSSTTKQKSKNTTETMSYVVNVIDGISGKEQKQWLCTAMIKLFERAGKKEKLRVRAAVKELDIDETNENIIYGILTSFYHNGVFYSENIKERVQKEIEKLDIEVE